MNKIANRAVMCEVLKEAAAKEQEKQGERLEAIEQVPAKNWDKLVWAIAGALIAGIIGYVLASLGVG